jgi:hypothetical protein
MEERGCPGDEGIERMSNQAERISGTGEPVGGE